MASRLALGVCIVVALAALALVPASADEVYFSFDNRWPLDAAYVRGNLSWSPTGGAITWGDPGTVTDPSGPARDPAQRAQTVVAWNEKVLLGREPDLARVLFTAKPAPATWTLNASRPIYLTLFVVPCYPGTIEPAAFDVELFVNGKFLAGQVFVRNSPANLEGGYMNQTWSLHPELFTIPKDGLLSLALIPHDACPSQFGFAGDHQSAIYLPAFSAYDLLYRLPSAGGVPATGAPQAGFEPFLPLAGLGSRRRNGPVLAAMLLATAGCLSSSRGGADEGVEPSGSGRASSTIVPGDDSLPLGYGTLAGTVTDDLGEPLGDVGVTVVVGGENTTRTNPRGQYALRLLAGNYTLRFDHPALRFFETAAKVEAGATTRLDVTLFPREVKEDERRRHHHDRWKAATETVHLEGDGDIVFPSQESCANAGASALLDFDDEWCASNRFLIDEGGVVLPGTYDVEVNVSWDPTKDDVDQVGVAIVSNFGNVVVMYPKSNREATHFQTTWEMEDSGHQHFSTWSFWLYLPTHTQGNPPVYSAGKGISPVASPPRNLPAPFHVDVTLHKGVVPYEPAHRDFWGPNNTVLIGRDVSCSGTGAFLGYTVGQACTFTNFMEPNFEMVPPETLWLEAFINQSAKPTIGDPVMQLRYTTAGDPPGKAQEKRSDPKERSGLSSTYSVKLLETEPDAFYQTQTFWTYSVGEPGADGTIKGVFPSGLDTITYKLTVIAHRDAFPSS